jgi:hypothetical protein
LAPQVGNLVVAVLLVRLGGARVPRLAQVHVELRGYIRHFEDPLRARDGIQHLAAGAGVVARDCGHRCPVDALRRETLCRVGARRAQPFLITGPRLGPERIECRAPFGIEGLNGEQCDLAMLGINPSNSGCRRPGETERQQDLSRHGDGLFVNGTIGQQVLLHEP